MMTPPTPRCKVGGVTSEEGMKITTYLGDYADVTLSDVDQDGLAIECHDEASAVALAAGIADLLRRYAVEPVAVGTVREPFSYSRVAEFVGPAVSVAGRLDQATGLDPIHRQGDLNKADVDPKDRLPA